jgi:DNA repair protein RadA/Sms
MVRPQTRYVCEACGESVLRWEGQCRACGAWNSLVETIVRAPGRTRAPSAMPGADVTAVPLAAIAEADIAGMPVGIAELDRVLGGGLVPGSLVLLGGEPGIGKSTLALQTAGGLAGHAGTDGVLYATGEESASQVRLRARRIGLLDGEAGGRVHVIAERSIDQVIDAARSRRFAAIVLDSVQTATVDDLEGPAGSVGQVREVTLRLMEVAKRQDVAVVLVGHVTKDGALAGPKTLEHLVDAVLALEGERYAAVRILRAVKNRFGSTEEVGVFEMVEDGLAEVADPSRAFLVSHQGSAPGSVVAPTLEGSRPLLVEVQALVSPSAFGTPIRRASGVDPNRLALLVAVLGRRAGIGVGSHDVYANLAGGLTVDEPGLDLPVALALASSLRDHPLPLGTVAIGEVGLLGELRRVTGLERRLREASRLGYRRAIVPGGPGLEQLPDVEGMTCIAVATLREAVAAALSEAPEDRGVAVPAMLG